MNISEKQKLWTKYYLLNRGNVDNFITLVNFSREEAELYNITDPKTKSDKSRKILRYMLKLISKKEILRKYSYFIRFKTPKNKNKIIDRLLKSV